MKNIAILTIYGNGNYGNKLQHYGLQFYLEKLGYNVETIISTSEGKLKFKLKEFLKILLKKRYRVFYFGFNKLIKYSKYTFYNNNSFDVKKYDYFIVGSDQVWNTTFESFNDCFLLKNISSKKRISYSSSLGINYIRKEKIEDFKIELNKFKAISVREDKAKEIIEKTTGRSDIEVVIDPTMLLTAAEWETIAKKPKKLKNEKYILNYFLGEISEERNKEIQKVAKDNDCIIINLLDKRSDFYNCGPSEFLYLEKNAFLICTDSFHSCVFSVIFDRPFVVFEREEKNIDKMNSRIDTLIKKFSLKNRKYNGNYITKENLNHNYSEAKKILENERKKSENFFSILYK